MLKSSNYLSFQYLLNELPFDKGINFMEIKKEAADVSILIVLFAIMIFGVFVMPKTFVQDDWYHLFQIWGKNFNEILNYFNIFQKGNLDSLNYYRPLSTKFYYFLMENVFGFRVKNYVYANWFLFFINGALANLLMKKLTKNNLLGIFIYCFNLVWFTAFSYVSISEVLIFNIFCLLTIVNFINKKYLASLITFILCLMTRETAVVIPLILVFFSFYKTKNYLLNLIYIIWFFALDLFYILARFTIYGLPEKADVYSLKIGKNVLESLAKYGQWSLNISGVLFEYKFLLVTLIIFLIMNFGVTIKFLKEGKGFKIVLFGIIWWIVFLMPVLFFENHIDPWNLIPAIFGISIVILSIWDKFWNCQIILTFLYFVLFITGLIFYSKNHWTKVRQNLVFEKRGEILENCKNIIIFEEKLGSEVDFAFYGTLGPKIMCNNKNLEVIYAQ